MTVLDAYQVQSYRHDDHAGIEHLAIARRDGRPIPSLADIEAVQDVRAPFADLMHVHLWLRHKSAGAPADEGAGDEEGAAREAAGRAASVAAAISPPSAATVAPRARRPRRAGGTLNLRDREIRALADHLDEYGPHVDDDSERADSLRAVRAKLARLPQAVTA